MCGGTRNKTGELTELRISPQNVCANIRRGIRVGWQATSFSDRVALFQGKCTRTSCLKPAPLLLDLPSYHVIHTTWALLQSKSLTCVLYPPCFCKLGIRRDGLSFTYGDIFNKGHGGYIDIWTLEIVVGSNGSL